MSQEVSAEALPEKPYRHFRNPRERMELFDFCKTTVEYIEEQGIETAVFIDRAARPLSAGINEYWDRTHSEAGSRPDIFFVNPDGFSEGDIRSRMEDEHPYLLAHKDSKVLLIDTCIHKGGTMRQVIGGLEASGFEDIRFAVAGNRRNKTDMQPDLVMHEGIPFGACFPFGSDSVVEKGGERLHSRSAVIDERMWAARGTSLRQEIKRIVREYLDNPPTAEDLARTQSYDEYMNSVVQELLAWGESYEVHQRRVRKATLVGAGVGALVGEAMNLVFSSDIPTSALRIGLQATIGAGVGRLIVNTRRYL